MFVVDLFAILSHTIDSSSDLGSLIFYPFAFSFPHNFHFQNVNFVWLLLHTPNRIRKKKNIIPVLCCIYAVFLLHLFNQTFYIQDI
jgi:hypothetical protein